MKNPQSIKKNEKNYKPKAWEEYTIAELGQWVHLFVKRSKMRDNPEKREKDLQDAQAYLDMIQEHINEAKK